MKRTDTKHIVRVSCHGLRGEASHRGEWEWLELELLGSAWTISQPYGGQPITA